MTTSLNRLTRNLSNMFISSGEEDNENHEEMSHKVAPKMNGPSEFKSNAFTFSDIDLLEAGSAKETLSDYQLTPQSSKHKKLQKCYLVREDRNKFWVFSESTKSCLLSAKKVGTDFYISMYEEFPKTFKSEDQLAGNVRVGEGSTYCAVVRLNPKTKSYSLYSRTCEGCDNMLGLHTCGSTAVGNDRQVLATVAHRVGKIDAGVESIDCNTVKVDIPTVYDDLSRDIWCPRFKRPDLAESIQRTLSGRGIVRQNSDRSDMEEKSDSKNTPQPKGIRMLKKYNTSPAVPPVPQPQNTEIPLRERRAVAGEASKSCELHTRKPRFDRNSGSLRMKFLNNRIRMASSKNLIFFMESNEPREQDEDEEANQVPVLQFGRFNEEKFSLDYGFPLSPLQAFGICLTLFQWQGPNKE